MNNLPFLFVLFITTLTKKICEAKPAIIDLTYKFNDKTPNHLNISKFELRMVTRGPNEHGNWVAINDFTVSEHSGTHIDSPAHVGGGTITVDKIPLHAMYRVPGVLIDVQDKIGDNINYPVTPADIQEWIDENGAFPDGCVVLFLTGWGEKAADPLDFTGFNRFQSEKMNYPGLGVEAAEFLGRYGKDNNQRYGVFGVGIDTLAPEIGKDETFPAHTMLFKYGVYALENMDNLEKLPTTGFTLTIMPLNIEAGSGGPTRIFAEIEGQPYVSE